MNREKDVKKQLISRRGEELAATYLLAKGYEILQRNWRSGRFSEIDLIAKDANGLLTFIEVKTRHYQNSENQPNSPSFQLGIDAIDWRKRRKMLIAARSFLCRARLAECGYSMDIILVLYDRLTADPQPTLIGVQILHVPQAFHDVWQG